MSNFGGMNSQDSCLFTALQPLTHIGAAHTTGWYLLFSAMSSERFWNFLVATALQQSPKVLNATCNWTPNLTRASHSPLASSAFRLLCAPFSASKALLSHVPLCLPSRWLGFWLLFPMGFQQSLDLLLRLLKHDQS